MLGEEVSAEHLHAHLDILGAHDEITLVYGTAAQQANPPSTYPFPQGE